jgi:ribonuclease HI
MEFHLRDHKGSVVMASMGRMTVFHDALSAEIHGCFVALTATMDQGMSHILLETDSTILIDAL